MARDDVQIQEGLLLYERGYSRDFVQTTIERKRLRGLRIWSGPSHERLGDLSFLKTFDFLRTLWIISEDDIDYDFLEGLPKLTELSVQSGGSTVVDLSPLQNLKRLGLQWRRDIRGLGACRCLKDITLIEYFETDLSMVRDLASLTRLAVKTSTIDSTSGLEGLTMLESVVLGACKRLRSIDGLARNSNVRKIELIGCPKVKNLSALARTRTLRELSLCDCGSIDSLGFINDLPRLETLAILENTQIADCDLRPAQRVRDVFYRHRPEYNIKLVTEKADALEKENLRKIRELFG